MADDDVVSELKKLRDVLESIELNQSSLHGVESRIDDCEVVLKQILKELEKGNQ